MHPFSGSGEVNKYFLGKLLKATVIRALETRSVGFSEAAGSVASTVSGTRVGHLAGAGYAPGVENGIDSAHHALHGAHSGGHIDAAMMR